MGVAVVDRRPIGLGRIITTGLLVTLSLVFFVVHLRAWGATHRPVGLGAMALDLVAVTLFIIRRQAFVVSRSLVAWIAAPVGAYGLLAVRPHYAPVGGLGPLCTAIQISGAIVGSYCLITLGRSFGIVAANRGVQTRGPYGIVRHPAYAAYCVTVTGYLLENPTWRNVFVALVIATAMAFRIREEEACLLGDPAYALYQERVRYRLLPLVF
jgi:protein-S-isoprenylcysteine O-methyltransferase Ste14